MSGNIEQFKELHFLAADTSEYQKGMQKAKDAVSDLAKADANATQQIEANSKRKAASADQVAQSIARVEEANKRTTRAMREGPDQFAARWDSSLKSLNAFEKALHGLENQAGKLGTFGGDAKFLDLIFNKFSDIAKNAEVVDKIVSNMSVHMQDLVINSRLAAEQEARIAMSAERAQAALEGQRQAKLANYRYDKEHLDWLAKELDAIDGIVDKHKTQLSTVERLEVEYGTLAQRIRQGYVDASVGAQALLNIEDKLAAARSKTSPDLKSVYTPRSQVTPIVGPAQQSARAFETLSKDLDDADKLKEKWNQAGVALKGLNEERKRTLELAEKGLIKENEAKLIVSNIDDRRKALEKYNSTVVTSYQQHQVLYAAGVNTIQSLAAGQNVLGTLFIQATQTIGAFGNLSLATLAVGTAIVAAGAAVYQFGKSLAVAQDEAILVQGRLTAIIGSAGKAREVFSEFQEIAMRTGASTRDMGTVFQRFQEGAKNVGLTNTEITRVIETVTKLGIVSGATTQEIQSGLRQLGQGIGSGKLAGDELKSVLENMQLVGRAIAGEMGTSIEGLRDLGAQGKITGEIVLKALMNAGENADKMFGSMPKTIDRASGQMARSWEFFLERLDRSYKVASMIVSILEKVGGGLEAAGRGFAPTPNEKLAEYTAQLEEYLAIVERFKNEGGDINSFFTPGIVKEAANAIPTLKEQIALTREQAIEENRFKAVLEVSAKWTAHYNRVNAEANKERDAAIKALKDYSKSEVEAHNETMALITAMRAGADAFGIYGVSARQAAADLWDLANAQKMLDGKKLGDMISADMRRNAEIKALEGGEQSYKKWQKEQQAKRAADQFVANAPSDWSALDRMTEWQRVYNDELRKGNLQLEIRDKTSKKVEAAENKLTDAYERADDFMSRMNAKTLPKSVQITQQYDKQIRELDEAIKRSKLSGEALADAYERLNKLKQEAVVVSQREQAEATRTADIYLQKLNVDAAKAGGRDTDELELQLAYQEELNRRKKEGEKIAIEGNKNVEEYLKMVEDATKLEFGNKERMLKQSQELKTGMGKAFKDLASGLEDGIKDAFAEGFESGGNAGEKMLNGFKKSFTRLLADLAYESLMKPIIMPVMQQVGQSIFGLSEGATNSVLNLSSNSGQIAGVGSAGNGLSGQLTNWGISKAGGWVADKLWSGSALESAWNSASSSVSEWLGFGSAGATGAVAGGTGAGGSYLTGNTVGNFIVGGEAGGIAGGSGAAGAAGAGGAGIGTALSGLGGAVGGGMLGGMLGTATQSKAVGGISGAALGGLGTYMTVGMAFGPMGLIAGAIVGAIMGILGTNKIATPYGGAWNRFDSTGKVYDSNAGGENGIDGGEMGKFARQSYDVIMGLTKLTDIKFGDLQLGTEYHKEKGWRSLIGGWDGTQVSSSDNPARVALDALQAIVKTPALMEKTGFSAPDIVIKAIKNLGNASEEEAVKIIALAGAIHKGNSAIDEMDVSLEGFRRNALKATEETFKPLLDDLDIAKMGGIEGEYKALLERQFRNAWDASTKSFSKMEIAMAELSGKTEATRTVIHKLGLAISDLEIDAAMQAEILQMRKTQSKTMTTTLWTEQGRGWMNSLSGILDTHEGDARDALALFGFGDEGMKELAKADNVMIERFKNLVRQGGVTNEAIDELISTFPQFRNELELFRATMVSFATSTEIAGIKFDTLEESLNKVGGLGIWRTNIYDNVASILNPGYKQTPHSVLAKAGVDPNNPEVSRWVREAMGSMKPTNPGDNLLITNGLVRQLEQVPGLTDQAVTSIVTAVANFAKETTAAFDQLTEDWKSALREERSTVEQNLETVKQLKKTFIDFKRDLLLDENTSPYGATRRRTEARSYVMDLYEKTKSSDFDVASEAMEKLPDAISKWLDVSSELNTTLGGGYITDWEEIQDILDETGVNTDKQVTLLQGQISRLDTLIGISATGNDYLKEAVKGIGKDLTDYGSNPALNRMLKLATGYTGDFKDGQFEAWVESQIKNPNRNWGGNVGMNKILSILGDFQGDFGGGGGAWGTNLKNMANDNWKKIAARELVRSFGYVPGFAKGGISYGPQLAMVSEGDYHAEAHVPLPDGKSIPVEFTNMHTPQVSVDNSAIVGQLSEMAKCNSAILDILKRMLLAIVDGDMETINTLKALVANVAESNDYQRAQ